MTTDREGMILDARPLVRRAARALTPPPGLTADDLESAGYAAVCRAADRFDPALGVPWPAYAATQARREMVDEIRRWCGRTGGKLAAGLEPDDGEGGRLSLPADPRANDPGEIAAARETLARPRRVKDLAAGLPTPAEVADQVTRLRAAMFGAVTEADVGQIMAGVVARAKDGSPRDVKLVLDLLAPARSGVTVQQNVATVVMSPSDVS